MIENDFKMIVHKLDPDIGGINLYALGDTQIGSPNFNPELLKNWVKMVKNDPKGYVVLVGDMINNAVKSGKSLMYSEKMRPFDQKMMLIEELRPIGDKLLGAVRGNHEKRSVKDVDDCPLYDAMMALGKEHLYRENAVFMKLNVGQRTKEKQVSYTVVLGHGVSSTKTKKFAYAIDGMDLFITGHTHDPQSNFPAKIVIDSHNEVVRTVGFTHIIVPSFDEFGGYVLEGMYMPQDSAKFPVVALNGKIKDLEVTWKTGRS